jgi:nicotinamidase-related amidase
MTPGWDSFLTPEDRELLRRTRWAKHGPFGLGQRPAILVVDAYYAALGVPRQRILDAIEEWPAACGLEGWAAIDRTATMLDQARSAGAPVIYLTGLVANPNPWNRKKRNLTRPTDPSRAPLQIVDELAPRDGELVLEKCTPSGFATSPLDQLLKVAGCDTVLVCGEATSGCVRATVVDACVLGYSVGVVADCCFDRIQASHWMNLFDMDQKYADVIDSKAAGSYLEGLGACESSSR